METAFNIATRAGDPIAYLVGEHETFHFQQYKYPGLNDPADAWVYEGQARSSQDKICIGARGDNLCFDDIAMGYAGYVPEINGYLANTGTPINQSAYQAALFWTYLTEKFGTFNTGDTVEGGMNLMAEFWKKAAATPNRDGIAVLNDALQSLGTPMRFRDIWKDFAVANYAKNLTGTPVPAKYKYADMAQPGGNYNAVTFTISQTLALNVPFLRVGETVNQWSARYYRFAPAATIPVLDIRVTQDTNTPVYYTILGIRNNGIAYEYNVEGRNLNQTVLNNAFSEVVIIVAGLENLANYRVAVNSTQPTLQILSPTNANRARVGAISAPEKFRVAVQLLAADGTPLTGIDLAQFNFRVDDKDVADDQILTSAIIQDQEWFVVRAPIQDAAGIYNLHVNYANSAVLSATQTSAVNYAPRTDADNMLIIDRSGSMAGAKLDAAKKAARLYVDSWRFGDMIGVVSYDHEIILDMPLQTWTDNPGGGTRQTAFNAIDGLTSRGATHIGDALMKGLSELQTTGNAAHDWALILLSDGVEEESTVPITVDFPTAINNIAGLTTKRPVIHAIAIGPNADGPKMQNAATATGGTYQFVSAPVAASSIAGMATTAGLNAPDSPTAITNARLDLDARYRFIATDILGHQQFFTFVGPLSGDPGGFESDLVSIPMEFSAAEVTFSLSFDGPCVCDVFLRDSLGNLILVAETDGRHYVWRASQPKSGPWTLFIDKRFVGPKVTTADAPQQGEQLPPYLIHAAVKSDAILDVDFPVPPEDRVAGVPMPIVATLTDAGVVVDASVLAEIVAPDNTTHFLLLLDDGLHGDGAEDDGIYANTFYKTGVAGSESGAGSYNVTVTASGNSGIAGSFVRQKILGFFIYSSGDDDLDLLPNEYEKLRTGSNTDLDPNADPDHDGRSTGQEFVEGTDPFDPDSDDGGESDGSESNNSRNPLDPSDDQGDPTWAVAYPGVSKVFVRYAPRPDFTLVQLWRSETLSGTYDLQIEDLAPSGLVTDTDVMNDQEYCYFILGFTAAGASMPTAPTCAMPKADPWPPDGGFLINNGADKTTSVNVTLNIFASDQVSPHTYGANPLNDLMLPPASSATVVTQMRISNRGDMSGAVTEDFANTFPWTLGQSTGLATVYMQFIDEVGNVSRIIPNSIFVEVDDGNPEPTFDERLSLPLLSK
jgi:hypothetical protein